MNRGFGLQHVQRAPRTVAPPAPGRGSRLFELVQAVKVTDGWHHRAACLGKPQRWWFGGDSSGVDTYTHARLICSTCPVREQCLKDALDNNIRFGVWGGKSPDERLRMQGKTYR